MITPLTGHFPELKTGLTATVSGLLKESSLQPQATPVWFDISHPCNLKGLLRKQAELLNDHTDLLILKTQLRQLDLPSGHVVHSHPESEATYLMRKSKRLNKPSIKSGNRKPANQKTRWLTVLYFKYESSSSDWLNVCPITCRLLKTMSI